MKNREEIRRKIQNSIKKLLDGTRRNGIKGEVIENFIMGILFYKFISWNLLRRLKNDPIDPINEVEFETRWNEWDKESLDAWKRNIVKEIGYFIEPKNLFDNVLSLANSRNKAEKSNASGNDDSETSNFTQKHEDISVILHKALIQIQNSAESYQGAKEDFEGIFSALNFNANNIDNDGKKETIIQLFLNSVNKFVSDGHYLPPDESNSTNDSTSNGGLDVFGEVYETLMAYFSSNRGKTGGEFYTPHEVSKLLTEITTYELQNKQDKLREKITVYDPACGTGSLLINFITSKAGQNIEKLYGQEINADTYNYCRMNMFAHGLNFNKFSIQNGDTLENFKHEDSIGVQKVDIVVSNPPFSLEYDQQNIDQIRFGMAGVLPPSNCADTLFMMHALNCIKDDGVVGMICPPGTLYRGGNEELIRKHFVENNLVEAVIELPVNLFIHTQFPISIIVFKKNRNPEDPIFLLSVKDQYEAGVNQYYLSEENLQNIINWYKQHNVIEGRSILVSKEDIANNKYNLTVGKYLGIENGEEVNIQEIDSQLEEINKTSNQLRDQIDEQIESLRKLTKETISLVESRPRPLWELVKWSRGSKYSPHKSEIVKYSKPQLSATELKDLHDPEGTIRLYISGKDILYAKEDVLNKKIEEIKAKNSKQKNLRIDEGEVLILADGGSFNLNYHNGKFLSSDHTVTFYPKNPDELSAKYLYYYLLSLEDVIQRLYRGSGLQNIQLSEFYEIEIPIIPIEEQHKIVSLLDVLYKDLEGLSEFLERELRLRKNQYGYYLKSLLKFDSERLDN